MFYKVLKVDAYFLVSIKAIIWRKNHNSSLNILYIHFNTANRIQVEIKADLKSFRNTLHSSHMNINLRTRKLTSNNH